jgi:hypothetical protein
VAAFTTYVGMSVSLLSRLGIAVRPHRSSPMPPCRRPLSDAPAATKVLPLTRHTPIACVQKSLNEAAKATIYMPIYSALGKISKHGQNGAYLRLLTARLRTLWGLELQPTGP